MDNTAIVSTTASQQNTVPEIVLPNDWCREGEHLNPRDHPHCPGCGMCEYDFSRFKLDNFWKSTGTFYNSTADSILNCFFNSITDIKDYENIGLGFDCWTLSPFRNGVDDSNRSDTFYQVFIPTDMSDVPSWFMRRALTSQPSGVHWAQHQIDSCLESHKECRQGVSSFLPKRLINIQPEKSSDDVVLEDRSQVPPDTRYAALSYCWGDYDPPCMTTESTLSKRQRCIPWHTLPRTFQDAVQFLRSLQVPYLWIDSICIIQDDEKDWLEQAGEMYDVYKNSFVTLAAGGPDSRAGLWDYGKRDAKQIATLRLGEKRWPLYRQIMHNIYCEWERFILCHDNDDTKPFPLFRRAWTYQERLVAPRVVYFDGDELAFWCFASASCQCGLDKYDLHLDGEPTGPKMKFLHHMGSHHLQNEGGNSYAVERAWKDMVEYYSMLELKVPGDRLVAIGGVAQHVQAVARPNDRYLAGLWQSSLFHDLLWRSGQKGSCIEGPTWSWASWCSEKGDFRIGYNAPEVYKQCVEIVDASCRYHRENPFGRAQSGKIVLRGRLLDCLVISYSGWNYESSCQGQTVWNRVWSINTTLPRRHFLLEMGGDSQLCSYRHYLVLHRLDEEGENIYERRGLMTFYKEREKGIFKKLNKLGHVTECVIT